MNPLTLLPEPSQKERSASARFAEVPPSSTHDRCQQLLSISLGEKTTVPLNSRDFRLPLVLMSSCSHDSLKQSPISSLRKEGTVLLNSHDYTSERLPSVCFGKNAAMGLENKKIGTSLLSKKGGLSAACFVNVEKSEARYRSMQKKLQENHVAKACELCDSMRPGIRDEDPINISAGMARGAEGLISKIFEDAGSTMKQRRVSRQPHKAGSRSGLSKASKACDQSLRARRMGISKADEFTGTEAKALKSVLKTLGAKSWTPELYFHIKFFKWRNDVHPMSAETRKIVFFRWHFMLRLLRTMVRIKLVLAERSCQKSASCVISLDMVESTKSPLLWKRYDNLKFDMNDFKLKGKLGPRLSRGPQKTLQRVKPEQRTPEMISQAVLGLQYVKDFAKLPTDIQEKLVAGARYLSVERNRTVLRQGHVAANYYFVLCGSAIAKRFLPNGKTELTGILKQGDGFGGGSILNNCPRLVTVVSQSRLDLLVIPRGVFLSQFGWQVSDRRSSAKDMLSKLWFMKSFPMEKLKESSYNYSLKKFRRTEIMVDDPCTSKWIFVVIKGICQVFQKIRQTRPKETTKPTDQWIHPLDSSSITSDSSDGSRSSRHHAKHYLQLKTLRPFDVFGLEDLYPNDALHFLRSTRKHMTVISDDVECVLLSKDFYQHHASPALLRAVHDKLVAKSMFRKQITTEDCSLITEGAIQPDPDRLLDPINPEFCIHCLC